MVTKSERLMIREMSEEELVDSEYNLSEIKDVQKSTENDILCEGSKNLKKRFYNSVFKIFLPLYFSYLILYFISSEPIRGVNTYNDNWVLLLGVFTIIAFIQMLFNFISYKVNSMSNPSRFPIIGLTTIIFLLLLIPPASLMLLDPITFYEFRNFDVLSVFFLSFSILICIVNLYNLRINTCQDISIHL